MTFLFVLIGALIAPYLCAAVFGEHTGWTSVVFGACVGVLLAQLRHAMEDLGRAGSNPDPAISQAAEQGHGRKESERPRD